VSSLLVALSNELFPQSLSHTERTLAPLPTPATVQAVLI